MTLGSVVKRLGWEMKGSRFKIGLQPLSKKEEILTAI